jgi:hypothetical protein
VRVFIRDQLLCRTIKSGGLKHKAGNDGIMTGSLLIGPVSYTYYCGIDDLSTMVQSFNLKLNLNVQALQRRVRAVCWSDVL